MKNGRSEDMKMNSMRTLVGLLILLICPLSVFGQTATTNRNVILRRDPSTASVALAHLSQGARLTLVDEAPDSGFYHVRTEDEQVGWVWSKFVTLSVPPAPPPAQPLPRTPPQPPETQCDPSLWSHVYHPLRLIVKQQCISVTGTIVDATAGKKSDGVRHEADGDTHGWLKVDPEFENLLNAGNISDEEGNLVFEIVCKFPVSQQDAKAACSNFTNQVSVPSVGSHVQIVGTLVQDTFHAKWMEIHPVTRITVLP
jgi:SH3 domain-containing protein